MTLTSNLTLLTFRFGFAFVILRRPTPESDRSLSWFACTTGGGERDVDVSYATPVTYLLSNPVTYLLSHPVTYLLSHPVTYLLSHLVTYLLYHLVTYLLAHLVTYLLAHLVTYLLSHPGDLLTISPGDLLTCSPGDLLTISPGDLLTISPGDLLTISPGDGRSHQIMYSRIILEHSAIYVILKYRAKQSLNYLFERNSWSVVHNYDKLIHLCTRL